MPSDTRQRILADMRTALKAQDEVRLRTLRLVASALQKEEIDSGQKADGLEESKVIAIVQRQRKQRAEAIQQYETANRPELVQREQEELDILQEYLPEQLDDAALLAAVESIVESTGASDISDMGRVMGKAMGQLKGKADGKRVQQLVTSILKR